MKSKLATNQSELEEAQKSVNKMKEALLKSENERVKLQSKIIKLKSLEIPKETKEVEPKDLPKLPSKPSSANTEANNRLNESIKKLTDENHKLRNQFTRESERTKQLNAAVDQLKMEKEHLLKEQIATSQIIGSKRNEYDELEKQRQAQLALSNRINELVG